MVSVVCIDVTILGFLALELVGSFHAMMEIYVMVLNFLFSKARVKKDPVEASSKIIHDISSTTWSIPQKVTDCLNLEGLSPTLTSHGGGYNPGIPIHRPPTLQQNFTHPLSAWCRSMTFQYVPCSFQ